MTRLSVWCLGNGVGLHSPVGKLMARILAESPEIYMDYCYELAKEQLAKAVGRKSYHVTTPKQDEKLRERLNRRRSPMSETAKSGGTTENE